METVEHEQARDQLVGNKLVEQRGVTRVHHHPDDVRQAGPVQVGHQADRLFGALAGRRLERLELLEEVRQPLADRCEVGGTHSPVAVAVGVCSLRSTLPLPRYMWTPQGRHGSKLRTARMMSMPLKFSGPFSSKMGVPCTASS